MMRPSDQAKLLFLYLLRSSSALATRATTSTTTTTTTTTSTTAAAAAAATGSASPKSITSNLQGHINLRLATRMDVPSIQRCNLASLPENYSSNFYINHMRSFPDLALVAEHVPPTSPMDKNSNANGYGNGRRNPFETYSPSKPESQIIGYVLGKIEHTTPPQPSSPSTQLDDYFRKIDGDAVTEEQLSLQQNQPEILGHVTSLAVLKPYRRNGLAALLMKQLHFHMKYGHSAHSVGLHVRVSNIAARRLYCEGMGYGVVDVIRGYYADGEDAFFMKKNFEVLDDYEQNMDVSFDSTSVSASMSAASIASQQGKKSIGSRWNTFRKKNNNYEGNRKVGPIYENGPLELRLPMIIPLHQEDEKVQEGAIVDVPGLIDDSSEEEEEDAHVMTGSL